jgi:hypothetical protein
MQAERQELAAKKIETELQRSLRTHFDFVSC